MESEENNNSSKFEKKGEKEKSTIIEDDKCNRGNEDLESGLSADKNVSEPINEQQTQEPMRNKDGVSETENVESEEDVIVIEKDIDSIDEVSHEKNQDKETPDIDHGNVNNKKNENVPTTSEDEIKNNNLIQCQICNLQVGNNSHLYEHLRGSHGFHEIRNQHSETSNECRECHLSKERTKGYLVEMTKEKEKRILSESNLDIKTKMLKIRINENEKLKSQIEKQNEQVKENKEKELKEKEKLLNDIKEKTNEKKLLLEQIANMKKEQIQKEENNKLKENAAKQKENDNNKLINELTEENSRMSNEKELYKKTF